ncbi:MAG: HAD family phosphatase [Actinobacteria bacterium ATB1]|nr:HAD family phosphatase [Actinobacteria bacterium ATB1]
MIEAVIFDFAGVLTTSPFDGIHDYEDRMGYPHGVLRRLMIGDYGAHGSDHPWHRLERGEITAADYWVDLVERCDASGYPIRLEEFLTSFGSFQPHDGMLLAARSLRPAYRTAILTNNVREYGDMWKDMIEAEDSFDHVFDSSQLEMRKPDPRIFLHACEVMSVAPDEAVFLDDSLSNVSGAEAVGLVGIHVEDHETAIEELASLLREQGNSGWPERGAEAV